MTTYWLKFTLYSDATFGRGDGVAGFVDTEIQHDGSGLPYLNGRTLRGLLNYECADILFALEQQEKMGQWEKAAQHLFGNPGSAAADLSAMRVGEARLPQDLRQAVEVAVNNETLKPHQVLASLTAIRRQTAIDESSGAPDDNSLRTERVILRQTSFEAELCFAGEPSQVDLALLAACVKAFRRAGSGRNRGRGKLAACLCDANGNDITPTHFEYFAREVQA